MPRAVVVWRVPCNVACAVLTWRGQARKAEEAKRLAEQKKAEQKAAADAKKAAEAARKAEEAAKKDEQRKAADATRAAQVCPPLSGRGEHTRAHRRVSIIEPFASIGCVRDMMFSGGSGRSSRRRRRGWRRRRSGSWRRPRGSLWSPRPPQSAPKSRSEEAARRCADAQTHRRMRMHAYAGTRHAHARVHTHIRARMHMHMHMHTHKQTLLLPQTPPHILSCPSLALAFFREGLRNYELTVSLSLPFGRRSARRSSRRRPNRRVFARC